MIGGLFVNSISIISDSIHDLGDAISIAISWFLDKKSESKPDKKYTYGYLRFSVLGALINAMVLLVGSIIMLYNAVPRLINPQAINYNGMFILAIVGLLVNGLGAYKTAKGEAISEKVVSLHLLEDVLGWAAVLICSIFMKIFNISILDPILSILITLFILYNVYKNLRKIFEVFLEKAPSNIDIDAIISKVLGNHIIKDIHHVHLWTLDSINMYATAHVLICDNQNQDDIIQIKHYVKDIFRKFGVSHVTLEIEFLSENCNEHECVVETDYSNHHHHHH